MPIIGPAGFPIELPNEAVYLTRRATQLQGRGRSTTGMVFTPVPEERPPMVQPTPTSGFRPVAFKRTLDMHNEFKH